MAALIGFRFRLGVGVVAAAVGAAILLRCGALPPGLLDAPPNASALVLDRHGEPLYEALSPADTRSTQLTVDSLPPTLVAATIAAEDRRFWRHPGIDPIALV